MRIEIPKAVDSLDQSAANAVGTALDAVVFSIRSMGSPSSGGVYLHYIFFGRI